MFSCRIGVKLNELRCSESYIRACEYCQMIDRSNKPLIIFWITHFLSWGSSEKREQFIQERSRFTSAGKSEFCDKVVDIDSLIECNKMLIERFHYSEMETDQ